MKCTINRYQISQCGTVPAGLYKAVNKDKKELGTAEISFLSTATEDEKTKVKHVVWIHSITVIPECRRKGIGAKIIKQIEKNEPDVDLIYAIPGTLEDEKSPISQEKIEHFYRKNNFKSTWFNPEKSSAGNGMCLTVK